MTVGRFLWIAGMAVAVMVINVAISFLWVWIYATFINRGHQDDYYRAYAERAAPYSSMIAGFPLMVIAAWILGSTWEPDFAVTAALTLWLVYTVVDVSIVAASRPRAQLWVLVVISQAIKLAGAFVGASLAMS